ncbi:MAG: glutathione synthase [Actinobacteria bacterium]|nr:glutathione synthase [Actinomycetota bacterium]
MKLGIFVNDVEGEKPEYTTTRLAIAAVGRGHDVWYMAAGDFACDPDDALRAQACRAPTGQTDQAAFLKGLAPERITIDDLDALWLRSDPADEGPDRFWAQTAGILFGGLAARRGVTVVNDPAGLSLALSKLYLHHFPPPVRPATLITRDAEEVRTFVADHDSHAVIKPLQGSGGQGVFIVTPDDEVNLDQMIEAVTRDGYLIAQEQLPQASKGDVRLFLLDGEPLQADGSYAAFRRVPADGEARSNMKAGATVEEAEIDETILRLAGMVGPRLAEDGMFLAGLDIVGDRILEINVFSPGGFGSVQSLTGVDFNDVVVAALEERVRARRQTGQALRSSAATSGPSGWGKG